MIETDLDERLDEVFGIPDYIRKAYESIYMEYLAGLDKWIGEQCSKDNGYD